MINTDAVWLACAIDGEGWMGLYFGKEGYPSFQIGVTNTSVEFIKKAHDLMGGSMRLSKVREGRKVIWRSTLNGHERALAILEEILPYLIIKKDKAAGIISFIKNREWSAKEPNGRKKRADIATKYWQNPVNRAERIRILRKGYSGVCTECGSESNYRAKGLCKTCYGRLLKRKQMVRGKQCVC